MGTYVKGVSWTGWKETVAIRSDADLMAEIKKGVSDLKKGKAKLYTLEELLR